METPGARRKPWLNAVLFGLTVVSTCFVGLTWSFSYLNAEALDKPGLLHFGLRSLLTPPVLLLSLLYAAVLMVILSGHELGHYLTCRRYGIQASLPYFIPAPTLIGTLGAFIRIRSQITRKHQLFDIGATGPLVGFLLALPALAVGLALSKVVPAPAASEGSIVFGDPLLLKLLSALLRHFPQGADIVIHPVGFAGWVGLLVTAFNLFPIGQLDGGHVAYALLGNKARLVSKAFVVAFIILGAFFWVGWFLWALIVLIIGLKHPPVFDGNQPLSRGRRILTAFLVLIFILSFIPDPVKGYGLIELLKGTGLVVK